MYADLLQDDIEMEAFASKKFQETYGRKSKYTQRAPRPSSKPYDGIL